MPQHITVTAHGAEQAQMCPLFSEWDYENEHFKSLRVSQFNGGCAGFGLVRLCVHLRVAP